MSNYFSYYDILKDREKFRKSGTKGGSDFNKYDSPGHKFFKIFFYFNNGDSDGISSNSHNGLLMPTWNTPGIDDSNYYEYNSAWSYLKMNYEDERADLLKQFVNLLSNISSESPWYFSTLSGIDTALDRPQINSSEFKFDEERKKLSIKCLPDSHDDRIGTLLDLYRSIVWSWSTKRSILPANLRKFDMGVFIFNSPVAPYNSRSNDNDYSNMGDGDGVKTSYKYIEFHNCEFDYNSAKSPLSELNNTEGSSFEYTIDIFYDDCYETRYNEYLGKALGDLIEWDFNKKVDKIDPGNDDWRLFDDYYGGGFNTPSKSWDDMEVKTPHKKGLIETAVGEVVGHAKQYVGGVIKKAVLGNMHTFSLAKAVTQAKDALKGHVFATASTIKSYAPDKSQENAVKYVNKMGNIFRSESIKNNI